MKKKVLIVNDNEVQRELVRGALEVEGVEVLEACGGQCAIKMVGKEIPDLAIIDIFMPDMDGLETITQLRALTSDMKIIALSSGSMFKNQQYLAYAKEFGADTGIAKPFKIDDLVKLVTTQLA